MDQTSETEKVYQRSKYEEIIEILLTAGYFRARINTLSEFDKVVGGLCWCIISSGEVVDVDILFQENSTIGQKIALSEAVVKTLRKMGCPAPLQPHQIQGGVGGSDYPALHLVIVWLVKKYFERRGEREQQLRAFSAFQFSKNYQIPSEASNKGISDNFLKVLNRNKATRLYRRKETAGESEETRVRSCLLEYGETFSAAGGAAGGAGSHGDGAGVGGAAGGAGGGAGGAPGSSPAGKAGGAAGGNPGASPGGFAASAATAAANRAARSAAGGGSGEGGVGGAHAGSGGIGGMDVTLAGLAKLDITELSPFEKQLARAAREAKKEEALFAAQLSKEEAELRLQMKELEEGAGTALSGSQVGNIVGMGIGEIGSALAAYQAELEESRKQLDSSLASGKLGQLAAFNRQKQNLLKQRDELGSKEREARITTDAMIEKLNLIEEERDGAMEYIGQLKVQLKKLGDLEAASSQQEELRAVQALVAKNDALRGEETAFKAQCKTQRQEYMDKITALEAELSDDTEENAKLRDVEDMHSKILSKYNRLRQLLAEANLEVAHAVRTIDDVPTRTELIQYERRFVELYQQVAWKLEETRKYYDMYNTLDTTLNFLQKEVKLLNSISENFHEAMKSTHSKGEFSKQFETIVHGVEDSLRRQQGLLSNKDQMVEDSKQIYQNLVDEQRKYFKAVKDFQDECNKNDWLTSKLEQITRGQ